MIFEYVFPKLILHICDHIYAYRGTSSHVTKSYETD